MSSARYVILNPSGNLTALVTEWPGPEREPEITAALMRESEQVAYLEPPVLPESLGRIRLMGGEFCGNAAMAFAGWLIRKELRPGETRIVPVEVSGARGLVRCEIRGETEGFRGRVEMPKVLEAFALNLCGIPLSAVRMEGICHLIREAPEPMAPLSAEALLRQAAAVLPGEEAIGFLDLNPETGYMAPLVFVRGSGTTVWETACGSGSAAAGALRALRRGNGTVNTPVAQPGGIIEVQASVKEGQVESVSISGIVRFGPERELCL